MLRLEEISEFYRLGLLIGYYKKSDIINWADSMLVQVENSNYHIIELSLGENLDFNEFSNHLSKLAHEKNFDISTKILISKIIEDLKNDIISIQSASSSLNRLSKVSKIPENDKTWLICFDDNLEYARNGIFGDLNSLKENMISYFSNYEKFNHLL